MPTCMNKAFRISVAYLYSGQFVNEICFEKKNGGTEEVKLQLITGKEIYSQEGITQLHIFKFIS